MRKYGIIVAAVAGVLLLAGCSANLESETRVQAEENIQKGYPLMMVGGPEQFPLAGEEVNGEAYIVNGICTTEGKHLVMVQMADGPIAYIPVVDEEQENSFKQGDKVIVTAGAIPPDAKGTAGDGTSGEYMLAEIPDNDLPRYDNQFTGNVAVIAPVCAVDKNGEEIHGILTQVPNGPVGFLQTKDVNEEFAFKPGEMVSVEVGVLDRN